MKRSLTLLGLLILAALNWAALHDILIGEPDVWMEWTFVVASGLLLVTLLVRRWRAGRKEMF